MMCHWLHKQEKNKILQSVNTILEGRPSMTIATQNTVKLTYDQVQVKEFLARLIINDKDPPDRPDVIANYVSHKDARIGWTMLNADSPKNVLMFAIEIAFVKPLKKIENHKFSIKKK